MNSKKVLTWVAFFLVFFVILQFFNKKKQEPAPDASGAPYSIVTAKNEYASGEEVIVKIRNNTDAAITIPTNCPKNPLRVLAAEGDKFEQRTASTGIKCALAPDVTIPAQKETQINYSYWNYALFGAPGKYKIELQLPGTTTIAQSPEFTVVEAGFWRKLFRTIFYQPIYNTLVLLISIAPARDLGFAIIILTILIRLVLLVPSQRAIVSQRRMQELQPKLEHIKKKFAGNQEKIAQETMLLWKEHKVNPFGSCLPLVIQFPVLIALFYVIRNGLNPDNIHLVYSPLKTVDLTNIHTNFLGILELTKVNVFVLPLIVGALQFFQLKLAAAKKKTDAAQHGEQPKGSEMETANKTMTYIMPVMIAMFTASVPAGVGLYWGISTAFALGQQLVANRKK